MRLIILIVPKRVN